jgi:hypothetical protein
MIWDGQGAEPRFSAPFSPSVATFGIFEPKPFPLPLECGLGPSLFLSVAGMGTTFFSPGKEGRRL